MKRVDVVGKQNLSLVTTWAVLTEAFYLLGFSWRAQDNLWEFIMMGGNGRPALECQADRALSDAYGKIPGFADGSGRRNSGCARGTRKN